MDLIERAAKKDKEKKSAGSLVERAAEKVGVNSKARAVGGIGQPRLPEEQRPDPSSLSSEQASTEEKKAFRGIGQSGTHSPQAKENKPGASDKKLAVGIGNPEALSPEERAARRAKRLAEEEARQQTSVESTPEVVQAVPASKVETRSTIGSGRRAGKREEQEIDLVALREAGYITPDMPPNLMSEEFRIIKRSILLNAFSKDERRLENGNVVLLTSSNPGEGKSFCAINLALSIATEQDTTVLLIDADFSKPEVLNRLGVSGGRGLMDVVADENIEIGDCLIRTNIPNLVLLPAGRQHNLTTELLASERMEKIVKEIGTRYPDRLVIFDSPPVLASSAASVLALYMGQTIFVIEAEKTTEPQIKESLSMISACEHINLLLNKTRYSGSNKKFASYYGYGGR
ncbi:MAG: AAA family ATPase [Alphaproteobacteria bacterium]|nr:AAA family ATPase [Alphaproteobacteria bacterium]